MKKYNNIILIIILTLLILSSTTACITQKCPTCENGPPYPNAHRIYRGKFYDTYDCGKYLMENECYKKAIQTFALSIRDNDSDTRYARTYSNHFIKDYFPNREQGISWYFLGEYEKAYKALILSIEQYPSEKAQYFLDKVISARFNAQGVKPTKPQIVIDNLNSDEILLTSSYPVTISGTITDPQFVSQILIKQTQIFQNVSEKKVKFIHKLNINEGIHKIQISAENLNKGISEKKISVQVDWTGPQIVISKSDNASIISGYVFDDIGLKQLRLNNRIFNCNKKKRFPFHTIRTGTTLDQIEVEDLAGNITKYSPEFTKEISTSNRYFFASNEKSVFYSDSSDNNYKPSKNSPISIKIKHWSRFDYSYLPEIAIMGEINSPYALKSLTINNSQIKINADSHILFSKKIHLKPGINSIKVKAVDIKENNQSLDIEITKRIPEAYKTDYRLRLAVYSFDSISCTVDREKFYNSFITALYEKNRFKILSRKDFEQKKAFWSLFTFHQKKDLTAEAFLKGRIIKSRKDIE
ncbi:conserved hypothetical protein, secreted, partial [Candidatus Magnetomorum sp. HK-1]